MSNSDFEDRLARLRQSHGQRAAPGQPRNPFGAPACNYRERLDRALAFAAAAGISRKDCFPPAMQALSALGLPVRPLHFKSPPSLFLSGLLLGLIVFGGSLSLFTFGLLPAPDRGPVAGLISLGWPGVIAVALGIGIAFSTIIRGKAARAGLPRWEDL